jgi:hypothetical protein
VPALANALALLGIIGGPCVAGVWLGGQSRSPVQAFVMGWVITPLSAFLLAALLLAISPPADGGGMEIFLFPLYGMFTGLLAGIGAAIVSSRRRRRELRSSSTDPTPGATGL